VSDAWLAREFGVATAVELRAHLLERRAAPFFWEPGDRPRLTEAIRELDPSVVASTLATADAVSANRFDLLGSGAVDLGPTIDWCADFKSGHRWPRGFCFDLARRPPGADVKVVWELARCQHFTTLGRAYWYSGDERYVEAFVRHLRSWLAGNPPWETIHWSSPMEVAIRLASWVWAYHFFADSASFDAEARVDFTRGVLLQAELVAENLEYFGRRSGNHYLADLVGLLFAASAFPELRSASRWRRIALRGLVEQAQSQVHEDGVHFEDSVHYHRLALEMLLAAALLCDRTGGALPASFWQRLEAMLDYSRHYTKPDGHAPRFGDADDSRLFVLGRRRCDDHRDLLAVGAVLFERGDFKAAAGGRFPEEALWLLGPGGWRAFERLPARDQPPVGSKAFPRGGMYMMRHGAQYLAVNCARLGRRGRGSHSHNDRLSFELCCDGASFIVDPGTYVYNGCRKWRDAFRSTAWHNTVTVDGQEMNRFPEQPFGLVEDAIVWVRHFRSTPTVDGLDAEHGGYRRLDPPVTHRRQFLFHKAPPFWVIRDRLEGAGERTLSWRFHFDAGIELAVAAGVVVASHPRGAKLELRPILDDPRLEPVVEAGWVSPSYGVKLPAPVVRYDHHCHLPVTVAFALAPPRERLPSSDLVACVEAALPALSDEPSSSRPPA